MLSEARDTVDREAVFLSLLHGLHLFAVWAALLAHVLAGSGCASVFGLKIAPKIGDLGVISSP